MKYTYHMVTHGDLFNLAYLIVYIKLFFDQNKLNSLYNVRAVI